MTRDQHALLMRNQHCRGFTSSRADCVGLLSSPLFDFFLLCVATHAYVCAMESLFSYERWRSADWMYTYCGSAHEPSSDVCANTASLQRASTRQRGDGVAQPNQDTVARFFSARRMDPPGVCFWVGSPDVCASKLSRV